MTDKIEQLKTILKEEIAIYKEWKECYGFDYCYDESYTLLDDLRRSQAQDIFEILIQE